jgi:hypothetical protein
MLRLNWRAVSSLISPIDRHEHAALQHALAQRSNAVIARG